MLQVSFFMVTVMALLQGWGCDVSRVKMVVKAPVVDLRSEPKAASYGLKAPALSLDVDGQESQLLYGECVLAEEISGSSDWVKVSAVEQQRCRNNQWTGYPGYVLKKYLKQVKEFPSYNLVADDLWVNVFKKSHCSSSVLLSCSLGTQFHGKKNSRYWWQVKLLDGQMGYVKKSVIQELDQANRKEHELRFTIVETAKKLIGSPYLWGGRSAFCKVNKGLTSIDCSSLIDLVFRAHGIQVPRDAHDQFLASTPIISGSDLKPGDLAQTFHQPDIPYPALAHQTNAQA